MQNARLRARVSATSTLGAALAAVAAAVILSALPYHEVRAEPYLAVFEGLQCSGCHSHPAGGGRRTAFGNSYAQTQLAAERYGNPDAPLWTGEINRWLAVGANLRAEYRDVDVPGNERSSEFGVRRGTVYAEATLVPGRLSVYVDQQFAPGASINREAYVRLKDSGGRFTLMAGQFFLPYGLRFEDDSTFVRQVSGANFTAPDRGLQLGYEAGPWSTQLSVTNGSGGGSEIDRGKQVSWTGQFVRDDWRVGASASVNNADAGDRQMQNVFAGVRTGPIAWLAEIDLIEDDLPAGGEQSLLAGHLQGNWRFRRGHNLKLAYDYFDPDRDVDDDHITRTSALWEYSPLQFVQFRAGARAYDGPPQNPLFNRDEVFLELHGFL